MNPRTVRRGVVLVAGLVVLAVAASLRRAPKPAPAPAPSASPVLSGSSGEGLVYRRIVDGKERGVVKARAFVGQEQEGTRLKEVEATFEHVYEGQPGQTTIVADECLYDAGKEKAAFQGNVKVTTTEGFGLESPSLLYNGTRELVRTEGPVDFRRGPVKGRAVGMTYEAITGELALDREVAIEIAHDVGPPTEIRSGSASASRSQAMMRFAGGVNVTRGNESLKAQRLNVNLTPDLAHVFRAVAVDDMELRVSAAPGAAPAVGGPRAHLLKGRKLDVWFDEESHEIRRATAGPDGLLDFPSGGAGEDRALTARFVELGFDGEGRLESTKGSVDAVLRVQPKKGQKQGGRTVKCRTLLARHDPGTGALVDTMFLGGVEIVEPKRRATAESARYLEEGQVLFLEGHARIVDEEEKSDLQAESIELRGAGGSVAARGDVRHLVTPRSRGGPLGGARVWQVASRVFDYDAEAKTGRYRENALLRAGDDEVRAALIVIDEARPGQRRLAASGQVKSVLHSREEAPEETAAMPGRKRIETESAEMLYEEAKKTVFYEGDVRIRQGDLTTLSPEATAFLNALGSRIETVVAGEPVEVRQGARRARGTRGTYTLRNETVVLTGDKVVLEDQKQRVQGRSLTFRAGDDTILVDGREVERTESVFRREPKEP
jgi:LPS export ABC transporter protein LptC/lipopolysaccharide transport protein LptA